ncbi:hypothetical protein B1691_13780 [Geobacillus sp. 47C-IIb]|jgi:putative Mg2+ transporter-C (MgtC) family protein|nr:MgtC/SapB family protein [Geobacillus sp. MR]OQP08745.1 hypothetical protein B1691_13780 [Geobacillus sp. 47C-IIb]
MTTKEVVILFTISIYTIIERTVLAAILGGIVGWERDLRDKQAGVKTHLLVSVGSALIMILSIYGFNETIGHWNARFDPARLAHGVISGIGFLGAGVIMRKSNRVSGITTAATLWVVASIGLCVGAGFYVPALVGTVIILINAFVLRGIESKLLSSAKAITIHITVKDGDGIDALKEISNFFRESKAVIKHIYFLDTKELSDNLVNITFRLKLKSQDNLIGLLTHLRGIEGVEKVECDDIHMRVKEVFNEKSLSL